MADLPTGSYAERPSDRTEVLVGLLGGILVSAGALLPWARIGIALPGAGREDHSIAGMDTSWGTLVLASGIVVIAVSIVARFWHRDGGLGLGAAVLQLAAGGLAAVMGILFFADIDANAVNEIIEGAGLDPEMFGAAGLKILTGASAVAAGWGLYLVILGGAVAFLAGVLDILNLRRTMVSTGAGSGGLVDEADPDEGSEG